MEQSDSMCMSTVITARLVHSLTAVMHPSRLFLLQDDVTSKATAGQE